MSDSSPEIRPAATVMLVRDSGGELEVLIVRRNAGAVFAGGMYVFPGGRVDPADGDPDADETFAVTAIREAFEEVGVLLARDAAGRTPGARHRVFGERGAVHAGERSFADVLGEHGLRAAVDELAFVDWWLTPKGELPRRFDTRFFLAQAPDDQVEAHDQHETVEALWCTPVEALARAAAGEVVMMPPTLAQLRFLAPHGSVAAALNAGRALPRPQRHEPRLVPGTFTVRLPGEPGFDDLD